MKTHFFWSCTLHIEHWPVCKMRRVILSFTITRWKTLLRHSAQRRKRVFALRLALFAKKCECAKKWKPLSAGLARRMNRIVVSLSHSYTHTKSALFNYRTRSTLLKRAKITRAWRQEIKFGSQRGNWIFTPHAFLINPAEKETGAESKTRRKKQDQFFRRARYQQKHSQPTNTHIFYFHFPGGRRAKKPLQRWRFFPCRGDGGRWMCVFATLLVIRKRADRTGSSFFVYNIISRPEAQAVAPSAPRWWMFLALSQPIYLWHFFSPKHTHQTMIVHIFSLSVPLWPRKNRGDEEDSQRLGLHQ